MPGPFPEAPLHTSSVWRGLGFFPYTDISISAYRPLSVFPWASAESVSNLCIVLHVIDLANIYSASHQATDAPTVPTFTIYDGTLNILKRMLGRRGGTHL